VINVLLGDNTSSFVKSLSSVGGSLRVNDVNFSIPFGLDINGLLLGQVDGS